MNSVLSEKLFVVAALLVMLAGCGQKQAEEPKAGIADGVIEPAEWGKQYPEQYELWKKTADASPAGKSRYKRGHDAGEPRPDKLDEYPFLALLYNGWGFGIEYKEPRGHMHMLKDQLEVDPSRLKAGGVCLTCKSPYAPALERQQGRNYYAKPFMEVLASIPKNHQTLGAACIDCHNNGDMTLRISHEFTLNRALEKVGRKKSDITRQDMRSLVCAQCHVTYNIPKDTNMKSTGVFFPWDGSKWGGITIENIIRKIKDAPELKEWTQGVTGFKLAFIRHPEFELYSNKSVHWQAGVSCSDCHMPYQRIGSKKISDHRVMSPLKNDFKACLQCHAESRELLRSQVLTIQDRTMSQYIRAGYAVATAAKLFELAHREQAAGKVVDKELYELAKGNYEEAFYRLVFIGAENSIGFHNPTETMRVLGDSVRLAGRSEAYLRQGLAVAGVKVPVKIDLELPKYLNNRGSKRLMAEPAREIKDPLGL